MTESRLRAIQRWSAAVLTMAVLVAAAGAPADGRSYDATKLEPGFLAEILADEERTFDVIVRAVESKRSARKDLRSDQAERAGTAVLLQNGQPKHPLPIVGGASARMEGDEILALTKRHEIERIIKDAQVSAAFDPVSGPAKATTPGILAANAAAAWSKYGVTGKGVGVAIVDSGVAAHPDLAGRIVAAIDFTSATPTVTNVPLGDLGGHGTHVAGLVAGDGAASGGAFTGSAPGANIIDVRVIDANGNSNVSIILRGLQWVLNNRHLYNIRVANMSFGATVTGSYKLDALATAAEVLTFARVAVVVSAGNTGPTEGTITSPAYDPYVITVGALDDNGTATLADDLMATFSSRGRTKFDFVSKPDLVAPGRKMVSLLAPGSTLALLHPDRLVTAPGKLVPEYYRLSGTSMAAPVVSGVLALMIERNPTLSTRQLKKRLKKSAMPLAFGTSYDRGVGLVDAEGAVGSIDPEEEYSVDRVTDSFARDMRKFIQGQPIAWKNLLYNAGKDSVGRPWTGITWENITWDNVTWENITWEAFTWANITWEAITWEVVTWQSTDQQSVNEPPAPGTDKKNKKWAGKQGKDDDDDDEDDDD